jgi:hypothetical protein
MAASCQFLTCHGRRPGRHLPGHGGFHAIGGVTSGTIQHQITAPDQRALDDRPAGLADYR